MQNRVLLYCDISRVYSIAESIAHVRVVSSSSLYQFCIVWHMPINYFLSDSLVRENWCIRVDFFRKLVLSQAHFMYLRTGTIIHAENAPFEYDFS